MLRRSKRSKNEVVAPEEEEDEQRRDSYVENKKAKYQVGET